MNINQLIRKLQNYASQRVKNLEKIFMKPSDGSHHETGSTAIKNKSSTKDKTPALRKKFVSRAKGSKNTDASTFNKPRREIDQKRSHK